MSRPIPQVHVISRNGCHLCENAISALVVLKATTEFALSESFIDGNPELEQQYGEQVPVITINGKVHDFYRVDPERFLRALSK